jgi:hypothetical protein
LKVYDFKVLLVSSQYLGVRAGLALAQVGNRKGLPLLFEKILLLEPDEEAGGMLFPVLLWPAATPRETQSAKLWKTSRRLSCCAWKT